MIREQNFSKGPIFGPLVRFALPILLVLMLYVFFKPAKKKLPINGDGEIL